MRLLSDTIVGLATSAEPAGIGVVRISGAEARTVLGDLVPGRATFEPGRLHLGRFCDASGHVLDEGYAVFLPGPRTFTGEDVAELHAHGGRANLERLLRAAIARGARLADRGEFTLRAFLAGRIDLAQAEGLLDVVTARTEGALERAQAQRRGGLGQRVRALRAAVVDVLARLEVQIDFIDEDLGAALTADAGEPLARVATEVEALAETWRTGRVLRDGARVVLAGPPNAGKSSLFNALLRTNRALVTPVPGTTRDYLEETLDLDGVPVVLIDTAGMRASDDAVEALGIDRSRELIGSADLVLWLDDPTQPEALPDPAIASERLLRIRTKADLAPGDISAVTGVGLEALQRRLRDALLPHGAEALSALVITSARHAEALQTAARALRDAASAAQQRAPPELIAVDVAEALAALGLITGETTTEDVLDRIFSSFCIGK